MKGGESKRSALIDTVFLIAVLKIGKEKNKMRSRLFIIAIFLLVAVGFTSKSFAANPHLEQHDTDIKGELVTLDNSRTTEHGDLDTKLDQLLSSVTPSVPQVIQRGYNATATSPDTIFDIGTFTVPPTKILVIELITTRVPQGSGSSFPISAITTVDGSTVEHSIGSVHNEGAVPVGATTTAGGNLLESFPLTIYADPNTDVIFRSITTEGNLPVPFYVAFSGRLIDVP
ncbi:MAG: hypothetical protein V3U58_00605 [Thermodesulfobacteriota bacterium]